MDNWLSEWMHNVIRDPMVWALVIMWVLVELFFRFKAKDYQEMED